MTIENIGDLRRTHLAKEVKPEQAGKEAVLMGYVSDSRDLGGIKFFLLRDATGTIQVTAPKKKVDKAVLEKMDTLTKESAVAVKGVITAANQAPGGVEIIPAEIRVLNEAITPLPLDPTGRVKADLDTRLDARLLDLRRPKPAAIFKIRHTALQAVRGSLVSKDFVEVHTPKIVASATESGAALFPISYFETEAFLSQSPQLFKEILTGCFDKVFEIGPIFRAEEHDTTRHLNEVISIDIEQAFVTDEDVMQILEDLTVDAFKAVTENCEPELETLERKLEVPKTPFPRVTYDDAIKKLEDVGLKIKWGEDLSTQATRKLGELVGGAYFIVNWPTEIKPFYIMPCDDDPKLSRSFDMMYEDLELSSGGMRIHQEELLKSRLKKQGLNPEAFEAHLKNFRWGVPPHAGWGLGLERLVMVMAGVNNIREAVLFPRDRKRLTP